MDIQILCELLLIIEKEIFLDMSDIYGDKLIDFLFILYVEENFFELYIYIYIYFFIYYI